jgi:AraC-like DNA-binding protein
LLWLAMQALFDDAFAWSANKAALLAAALALGGLAALGMGGLAVGMAYKLAMIGFAVAALWTVLKDWRSDLVSNRRRLRLWVASSMGLYVLLVLGFELLYIGAAAPRWLEVLNLGGITLLSGAVALVSARHPVQEWLGATEPSLVPEPSPVPEAKPVLPASPLTPPPPALDRKAALQERLLHTMAQGRAYAQEGLTLAHLANQLDASPAQLRDAIHHGLGYRNFNDFLHHYRVDEAAQRLLAQDLPILSIALDVGYGSIGPFNRAFKQIKGVTPTEWRARAAPKA